MTSVRLLARHFYMKNNTHFATCLYRCLNIETKLVLTSENCINRNVFFFRRFKDSFFFTVFRQINLGFCWKKVTKIFVPDMYYKEIIDKCFEYILFIHIYILKASKKLILSKFTHSLEKEKKKNTFSHLKWFWLLQDVKFVT